MTAFKIGGAAPRPVSGPSGGRKPERKSAAQDVDAPSRGAFDTASVNANPLAVMPRMSALDGQSAQRLQGETAESLLRCAAAELDDYFSKAYGFKE